MLLPAIASVIARTLPERGPVPARLAAARLGAAPGHAVVAAAGVLTSVALAAAMAMMVASFRNSVDQWLTQVLPADLYLRTGGSTAYGYTGVLPGDSVVDTTGQKTADYTEIIHGGETRWIATRYTTAVTTTAEVGIGQTRKRQGSSGTGHQATGSAPLP